jgi:2-oxoglutarate ferredoxin oxidoreductase subunit delta
MKKVKDRGEKIYQGKAGKMAKVVVYEKMCKGCEICVQFCPVKILEMKGQVVICNNADKCTKCMLCEMRCPDFAIKVE